PCSTLVPYTTLFRSLRRLRALPHQRRPGASGRGVRDEGDHRRRHHRDHRRQAGGARAAGPAELLRPAHQCAGPGPLPRRARGGGRPRSGGDLMIETLQEWAQNPLFHRWEGGLWQNTVTTLYMTGVTMALTVLLGLPLGIAL